VLIITWVVTAAAMRAEFNVDHPQAPFKLLAGSETQNLRHIQCHASLSSSLLTLTVMRMQSEKENTLYAALLRQCSTVLGVKTISCYMVFLHIYIWRMPFLTQTLDKCWSALHTGNNNRYIFVTHRGTHDSKYVGKTVQ